MLKTIPFEFNTAGDTTVLIAADVPDRLSIVALVDFSVVIVAEVMVVMVLV